MCSQESFWYRMHSFCSRMKDSGIMLGFFFPLLSPLPLPVPFTSFPLLLEVFMALMKAIRRVSM